MRTRLSALGWGFSIYSVCILISMATMSIGAGLLGLVILIWLDGPRGFIWELGKELEKPLIRRYFRFSLFLSLMCILSLIVAKIWPLHYGGMQSEIHFWNDLSKLWYLFWPLILVTGLRRLPPSERAIVLRFWLGAFVVLSVIGIFQFYTGWPRPQRIPVSASRFHTTLFLGHHLSVASVFIFPFFAMLDFAWKAATSSTGLSGLPKKFLYFGVVVGGIALFTTYSRTLWVALPIGVLLWLVWTLPRKWAAIAVVLTVLCGVGVTQLPGVSDRIHDAMGITTRQDLWMANLEFFKARPLTGAGWHHNQELSGYYLMNKYQTKDVFSGHAHNNVIDFLGGTGALGLIAWLMWCGGIFSILWKGWKSTPAPLNFAKGLICAWVVFQINGLTQMNFWEGKVIHQLMWVTAWSLLWITGTSAEKQGASSAIT